MRTNRMVMVLMLALPLAAQAKSPVKPAMAEPAAYAEMKAAFGLVPSFIKQLPPEAVDGAWEDLKGMTSPGSAIPAKYKDLISIAVAAQVPCKYCLYFDTKLAMLDGASQREVREAVLLAALTRKASTILNGSLQDEAEFRKEADKVFTHIKKPAMKMMAMEVKDQASALKDIEQTLGSVPSFMRRYPPAALAGFWKELKGVQLSPNTALPGKYKELIGVAVAAQIPCKYCLYFHREAAKLGGATQAEIDEAIAVAADVRHWSTFIHGVQIDEKQFRAEVDQIVAFLTKQAAAQGGKP